MVNSKKSVMLSLSNLNHYLIVFFLFGISSLKAQKETNIWYFGDKAGLDFNSGAPLPLLDNKMSLGHAYLEGTSSVADKNGHLLFYTDGDTIWDKSHSFMPNGTGLFGDKSSTQSALITPVVGNKNQYYVFTVDGKSSRKVPIPFKGLHYSVVDISLPGNGTPANPLGEVVASKKNINLTDSTTEKLTATMHSNGIDYWIITRKQYKREIHAYLVNCSGVSSTPVISYIPAFPYDDMGVGELTASADGKTLVEASAMRNDASVLMHGFNNTAGLVTSTVRLGTQGGYGVAFSPNDSLIYVGSLTLRRYQRFASNVNTTEKNFNVNTFAGMQLGPDGKIYIAINSSSQITTINNPNSINNSYLAQNSVSLGGRFSSSGLPNFFMSYFNKTKITASINYTNTCFGDTTTFSISNASGIDSLKWQFGDVASGAKDSSTLLNPSHVYTQPGTYLVKLVVYKPCFSDTLFQNITIHPLPLTNEIKDTVVCKGEKVLLTVGYSDSYLWSTGETTHIIEASGATYYWVNRIDANGCVSKDSILITEEDCSIYIPNSFTPNKDGINDVFHPIFSKTYLDEYSLKVYNKWGELVFETQDSGEGWNGTYKNQLSKEDAYVYQIYIQSKSYDRLLQGHLLLIH